MAKHGKKYLATLKQVDRIHRYDLKSALELAKKVHYEGFDASVDIAVRLSVDPRHADQMVRGACILPNGTGKSIRVLVFAKGDKEHEAREAGADFVGGQDMVQKIQEGWLDFDKAIATPDMMGMVGRIGRILGPRGMMPNPKVGTVTMDVARAVKEMKAGRVEFRVERAGIIHAQIGRVSFGAEALEENAMALLEMLAKLKPASAKGQYMKSVTVHTTMGPGIKVDPFAISFKA